MKRIFTLIPALFLCSLLTAQQGTTYRWKAGNATVSGEAGFLSAANWWIVNGVNLVNAVSSPTAGATLEISGSNLTFSQSTSFSNPFNIHVYSDANASSSLTLNRGVQLNLPQGSVIRIKSNQSNSVCYNSFITLERTGGTQLRINNTIMAQASGGGAVTLNVVCTGTTEFIANGLSTTGPVAGFRGFTALQGSTLPVTLVGFTASKGNGKVVLNWSTAQELNSDFFEIQRSTDGSNWKNLSRIKAAGNSDATRNYQYEDAGNFTGTLLYRIRMVDQDETYSFSTIARLSFSAGKGKIYAYPNPANAFTTIVSEKLLTGDITVGIYHMTTGGVVKQQVVQNPGNVFRFALDGVAPGNYIIKVYNGQELLESLKLIKK